MGKYQRPAAIQSISRATKIIICLSNGIDTVTEIADYCKLSQSTVHRVLRALIENQLALQNPINHRYYLGQLIIELTSKSQTVHRYLTMCAIGEMRRLSDVTEETITLSLMMGVHDIFLYSIPGKSDLRVITDGITKIGPTCVGATEKVLFSQLENEDRIIAIKHIHIKKVTDTTVTEKNELLIQLEQIRRQGYAISYGERIKGALCMAASINNYTFPAALALLGPEGRINPKINSFLKELIASANCISNNLKGDFLTVSKSQQNDIKSMLISHSPAQISSV